MHRHIEEVDLLRFLTKEEVDLVIPLFEGAPETGKIKKSALKNWVVMEILNAFTISISFLFQNLYEHAIDWFKCLMSCILILRTDAVAVMGLESCVAAKICI